MSELNVLCPFSIIRALRRRRRRECTAEAVLVDSDGQTMRMLVPLPPPQKLRRPVAMPITGGAVLEMTESMPDAYREFYFARWLDNDVAEYRER